MTMFLYIHALEFPELPQNVKMLILLLEKLSFIIKHLSLFVFCFFFLLKVFKILHSMYCYWGEETNLSNDGTWITYYKHTHTQKLISLISENINTFKKIDVTRLSNSSEDFEDKLP